MTAYVDPNYANPNFAAESARYDADPPKQRAFAVLLECRALTAPHEQRTFEVPHDCRTRVIPHERRVLVVPFENRTLAPRSAP